MTEWFRKSSPPPPPAPPPPPGGSGGSGFGGVGGAPPGPETADTAARSAQARREGRRGTPTTAEPDRGGSESAGGSGTGTGARTEGSGGRRGLPLVGLGGSSTPEEQRFSQVYAEDRVGPMPYPNQASPDVAAARGRVRALVNDLLPGGVDEGTGAALDPLIASWASGWLSRIDSQHADHHAVVDRLVGGARRQLADAEAAHERDRRALEIARTDYTDARERLIEPSATPDTTPETPRDTTPDRDARSGTRRQAGGRSMLGRLGDRLTRRSAGDSGRHGAGPSGPYNGGPSGPYNGGPSGPYNGGPSGPYNGGPSGGAGGGPSSFAGRPEAGDRVGPSEPATRPVRIPPSTYGTTFDEPAARATPDDPAAPGPGTGPGEPSGSDASSGSDAGDRSR